MITYFYTFAITLIKVKRHLWSCNATISYPPEAVIQLKGINPDLFPDSALLPEFSISFCSECASWIQSPPQYDVNSSLHLCFCHHFVLLLVWWATLSASSISFCSECPSWIQTTPLYDVNSSLHLCICHPFVLLLVWSSQSVAL